MCRSVTTTFVCIEIDGFVANLCARQHAGREDLLGVVGQPVNTVHQLMVNLVGGRGAEHIPSLDVAVPAAQPFQAVLLFLERALSH